MKKVVILLILFAFFIFLCGAGHLLRFLDLADTPLFRAVNILTALVSIATSVYLVSFCTVYSCVFIYENHFHSSQYQYLLAVPSYSHKMPFVPNLLEGTDKFYLEATTSKEIVEKMYPPQIRERLLSHEQSRLHGGSGRSNSSPSHGCNETKEIEMKETDSCNKKNRRKSKEGLVRQRIQEFVNPHRHNSNGELEDSLVHSSQEYPENHLLDSVPIADDFNNTSIMFADISSFTHWASEHSPIQVFTLLESLFYEFDCIANKMGVYKLSTVGDCYIASAGVPYPQQDHAIVITVFAECCRQRAKELFIELSPKLKTRNLGIRIGIHSGPVTAGVLRGDKARFDIFGGAQIFGLFITLSFFLFISTFILRFQTQSTPHNVLSRRENQTLSISVSKQHS